jgi:hypothetical protein
VLPSRVQASNASNATAGSPPAPKASAPTGDHLCACRPLRGLTDRRLIFLTVTGKIIDIPRTEIVGVREAKAFKTSVRGGRTHLIVQIPSGEIAFYVSSNIDWINAITTTLRSG